MGRVKQNSAEYARNAVLMKDRNLLHMHAIFSVYSKFPLWKEQNQF